MNSIKLKRLMAGVRFLHQTSIPRRVVIYYHAVGDGPHAVSADLFQRQMSWLADKAEVLSLDELLGTRSERPLQVAITFDDGYACVAYSVEPILRDLDLTATVYINTGWMGEGTRRSAIACLGHYQGERFMAWDDVEHLRSRNWIIGSHGVDHLDLTALDQERIILELGDSKAAIEDRLGIECRHFAYTWGRYNLSVQRAVRDCGYRTGASAIHGPITTKSDIYAFPRIDISKLYTLEDFKAVVRGDWDFIGVIQRARRLKERLLRQQLI